MEYEAHKARMLAHYLALMKVRGWKDYVLDRVAYMAEKQPWLYAEMDAKVRAASASHSPVKRSAS